MNLKAAATQGCGKPNSWCAVGGDGLVLRADEVSSATDVNTKEGDEANRSATAKTRRPMPIPLEVPVSVTGARPATKNDKRELFTEETTTVLVFKDGAVIQLSAAIVVGQLLFLTDKRSKREVVCQVVHKRSHRPTSCYVELEFTEPVNDFWGVSFPEPAESAVLPPTVEAVEAEETTEDDRSEPVEAPKSEDVAQLKDEVEALRAQLRELKQKQAEEEKKALEEREAQARRLAEAEAAARAAAQNEAREKTARAEEAVLRKAKQKEDERPLTLEEEEVKAREEARQWEEDSIAAERERRRLEQERKDRDEAERAQAEKEKEDKANARKFGMKLPIGAGAPETQAQPVTTSAVAPSAAGKAEAEVTDELLPRPALDFSRAPKGLDPNDPYGIYKPVRRGPGKLEALVGIGVLLLILGGGGFAWYKNWLPFLHRAPKTDVATKTPPGAKPVAVAAVSKPAPMPSGANAGTAGNGGEANAEAAANSNSAGSTVASATPAAAKTAPGEAKPAATAAGTASEPPADKSDSAKKSEKGPEGKKSAGKKEAGANAKPGKNHGKAETSSESKPKPAEDALASDAPVVPAKLLHAVPPVYPPDAMRGYITGDVRIEAVVDAKGHLGEMNVLVGPAPLRQAAMDALKQYEYAPATQGGKAVVSTVTVTIKFWFDP